MPQAGLLPPVITPKGISHERAEYLFKEIREFCRPEQKTLLPLKSIELRLTVTNEHVFLIINFKSYVC